MDKSTIISLCRFYRGEITPPDWLVVRGWSKYWVCEQYWVREMLDNASSDALPEALRDDLDRYENNGLSDFNSDDDVPLQLKAFLLRMFSNSSEGLFRPEEFRKWYDFEYIPFGDFYRENVKKKAGN